MDLIQILTGSRTQRNLVEGVEEAVRRGLVGQGDRLPSVRSLAAGVGVSPTTVAAAYADLRRRGIVVSAPRSGVAIAQRPPLSGPPRPVRPGPPVAFDCSIVLTDAALLPDLGPALLAALAEGDPGGYGREPVDPRLASIAHGRLPPGTRAAVALTSGALDGVERALATVASPGDRVAVEDPGHANLLDLVRAAGLLPEPVAIDDEGPLPAALDAALAHGARAAIITRRGQDPFGAALTPARADALAAVLARHPRALLIEDDHLGDVGDAAPTLAGRAERWVSISSLSKAYGPDLRLALVTGDEATVGRLAGRFAVGPGWVSLLLQRTAVRVLDDPAAAARTAVARATWRARRLALADALADHGIACHGASGLAVWIPVADEATVCLRLREEGILVNPGARYRLRAAPAIRVVTAALAVADAPAIAAAIARATAGVHARLP
jgi:DNA-binding transcriptional MocR family regulator